MRRNRRPTSTLSLSFLDIMACGFGAATLLFLLLKHEEVSRTPAPAPASGSEVNLLVADLRAGERELATLRNALAAVEQEVREARGRARRLLSERPEPERSVQADPEPELAALREEIARLERETEALRSADTGAAALRISGQGDRQYLTGLKLGGARVLILVDASASMLDETIVEVIRRRMEQGTSVPKGMKVLGEWSYTGGGRVFTLVDIDDPAAMVDAASRWTDIGKLEAYPALEVVKVLPHLAEKVTAASAH